MSPTGYLRRAVAGRVCPRWVGPAKKCVSPGTLRSVCPRGRPLVYIKCYQLRTRGKKCVSPTCGPRPADIGVARENADSVRTLMRGMYRAIRSNSRGCRRSGSDPLQSRRSLYPRRVDLALVSDRERHASCRDRPILVAVPTFLGSAHLFSWGLPCALAPFIHSNPLPILAHP